MKLTLHGNSVYTNDDLPEKGSFAKSFILVDKSLKEVTLESLGKRTKLFNVFPSIDTDTCAKSVRKFYEKLSSHDVLVCNISKDLPFALNRFCAADALESDNFLELSDFRGTFAEDYGLIFVDGPLKGLCSRAVILLDSENKVLYTQQVKEITEEPNYEMVLNFLNQMS